jgi:hypothetical protein
MTLIDLKLTDPNWALGEILRFTRIVFEDDTMFPDGLDGDAYPHASVANVRAAAAALAKLADAYGHQHG